MRAIIKGREPQSLTQHRASQHCNYDNYADKANLRAALVHEQHGICCYCMGRIHATNHGMKIEHWRCQARHAGDELSYTNLLGACMGGEGNPAIQQHCDTRKGDRDLRWSPANPQHAIETRVVFDLDGTIRSPHPEFNDELNSVLNLNMAWLKQNRKQALDGLLTWYRTAAPRPNRTKLLQKYDKLTSAAAGTELGAFSPVAAAWIKRKLEA